MPVPSKWDLQQKYGAAPRYRTTAQLMMCNTSNGKYRTWYIVPWKPPMIGEHLGTGASMFMSQRFSVMYYDILGAGTV